MDICIQQQTLCTLLALSVLIILLSSEVESLPVEAQLSSKEDKFLSYLESLETGEDGEDRAKMKEKRLVPSLGSNVDPKSLTVGDLIYRTYVERKSLLYW